MKGIQRKSTRGMSREAWLAERRKTIGGSDAAGIMGLSKWSTPYSVWAEKTGRLPDKPDSEAMRLGRDLEDYVARRWTEQTGKKVRRVQAMLYNPQYPFAHADVDRMAVGEDAGLECKTTSALNVKKFQGVEFPEQYYAQCVHYLAVTGAARWHLAVLVFGRGFFTYTLERDQAEIDALMAEEAAFWALVEADTPPAVDGLDPTTGALETIYAGSSGEQVELFGRESILEEYGALRARRKELDGRLREIENTIKEDMKDAQRAACGRWSITWKPQERRTFQARPFAQDHPEMDLEPYYKTTVSRTFKVMGEDEKEAG